MFGCLLYTCVVGIGLAGMLVDFWGGCWLFAVVLVGFDFVCYGASVGLLGTGGCLRCCFAYLWVAVVFKLGFGADCLLSLCLFALLFEVVMIDRF